MPMVSIPFPGTKRYSYKHVKRIFEDGGYESFLEPFGGSCVLSANIFKDGLTDKVYINDYDRFFDRYPEALDKKDWIVRKMNERGIFRSSGSMSHCYRYTSAEETEHYDIKTHLLSEEEMLYLQSLMVEVGEEWWRILSFGSCFNHATVPLHDPIRLSDFRYFKARVSTKKAREFLAVIEQIERDTLDWSDFLDKHADILGKGSLVVLDPPYFGTMDAMYSRGFTEEETLKILKKMKEIKTDFIFFNNNTDWMEAALESFGFDVAEMQKVGNVNSSMSRKRLDGMAYVRQW